jgi:ornithine cyclodeaminase/alanine dehydrogenase-like protein (mu-crystallin family)
MDSNVITTIRTGAVGAIVAKHLIGWTSESILYIGSRGQFKADNAEVYILFSGVIVSNP